MVGIAAGGGLLLLLDDDRLGRQEEAGDRRGILECRPGDLGRVDDAEGEHVAPLAGLGVVAEVGLAGAADLVDDDRAVEAGVLGDRPAGLLQGASDDLDAEILVAAQLQVVEHLGGPDQSGAAPGDDPLLDRGPGGMQGVLDEGLALLHLRLGRGADVDLGDAAGELGEPLLELLAVIFRVGRLDLPADQLGAALDGVGRAPALDDRGVVAGEDDLGGPAEVAQLDVLQVDSQILEDRLAAGQRGDVLEHGLASVAIAGGLDRADLEDAAELVDDQGRQRLALDVLGDDQQRLVRPGDLLQQGDEHAGGADLLLVDEDIGIFEDCLHAVLVGDEVGAEVAAVELHALDDVDLGLEALALLDGDHAVGADLLEGVGQALADALVAVGGDRGDLGDLLLLAADALGVGLHLADDPLDGQVDATLQGHRVGPGGQGFQAFLEDRLGQDGRRGGAVPGGVGGLAGGLLHELGTHVLVGVGQLDLLGHGHAVLGHRGAAPALVDDRVSASGAERAPHGLGQLRNAAGQLLACFLVVSQQFRHGRRLPPARWRRAMSVGLRSLIRSGHLPATPSALERTPVAVFDAA